MTAMTIATGAGRFRAVVDDMRAFLADLGEWKVFADLDDTRLGAIALKLAAFAGDAAEAMTAAGVPMAADDFDALLATAEAACSEIASRIEQA